MQIQALLGSVCSARVNREELQKFKTGGAIFEFLDGEPRLKYFAQPLQGLFDYEEGIYLPAAPVLLEVVAKRTKRIDAAVAEDG